MGGAHWLRFGLVGVLAATGVGVWWWLRVEPQAPGSEPALSRPRRVVVLAPGLDPEAALRQLPAERRLSPPA